MMELKITLARTPSGATRVQVDRQCPTDVAVELVRDFFETAPDAWPDVFED